MYMNVGTRAIPEHTHLPLHKWELQSVPSACLPKLKERYLSIIGTACVACFVARLYGDSNITNANATDQLIISCPDLFACLHARGYYSQTK